MRTRKGRIHGWPGPSMDIEEWQARHRRVHRWPRTVPYPSDTRNRDVSVDLRDELQRGQCIRFSRIECILPEGAFYPEGSTRICIPSESAYQLNLLLNYQKCASREYETQRGILQIICTWDLCTFFSCVCENFWEFMRQGIGASSTKSLSHFCRGGFRCGDSIQLFIAQIIFYVIDILAPRYHYNPHFRTCWHCSPKHIQNDFRSKIQITEF